MNRRQEGKRVREIVAEVTGDLKVSVKTGRGTACNWWYVKTSKPTTWAQQDEVEKRCGAEELVGYYYGDYGPGPAAKNACVRWEVER